MVARRARWRKAEQFIPIYGRRLRKRELGSELDEPRGSSFVILSAAKNPGSFSTLTTAASTTDRRSLRDEEGFGAVGFAGLQRSRSVLCRERSGILRFAQND